MLSLVDSKHEMTMLSVVIDNHLYTCYPQENECCYSERKD